MALSSNVIQHKNSLTSGDPIYALVEINIPSLVGAVYLTNNNEDVTWNSINWISFGFTMDEISEDGDGSIPEVGITISNVTRAIETYLIEYNDWLKSNPHEKITVELNLVSASDLANTTPITTYSFDVGKFTTDAEWATFTLTFENFYLKRFPKNRIMRNSCRWKFGSTQCGYTPSVGETCNKTLSDCRTYNNSSRYGGFPSAGGRLDKVYL